MTTGVVDGNCDEFSRWMCSSRMTRMPSTDFSSRCVNALAMSLSCVERTGLRTIE